MAAIAKVLGPEIPPIQIACLRFALAVPVVVIAAQRCGGRLTVPARPGLHLVRGLLAGLAMTLAFSAFARMRLGDATALLFFEPLFIVFLVAVLNRRRPALEQWLAALLGLTGALVILQPGSGLATGPGLLAIAAALCQAGVALVTRELSRDQAKAPILMTGTVLAAIVLALPTAQVWVTPSIAAWMLLVLLALAGTAGQALIIAAYRLACPGTLAPVEYVQLPLALLIGLAVFGEPLTAASMIGSLLIIAAALSVGGLRYSLPITRKTR